MSSLDSQVAQIEQNIKEAAEQVATGSALARLFVNRDFKKVVLEGYFREESIRLVHLLADPNMQTAEKQTAIVNEMRAVGAFREYLRMVEHKASLASKSIAFDEETLAELTQGE
jgi:hypothetical protein